MSITTIPKSLETSCFAPSAHLKPNCCNILVDSASTYESVYAALSEAHRLTSHIQLIAPETLATSIIVKCADKKPHHVALTIKGAEPWTITEVGDCNFPSGSYVNRDSLLSWANQHLYSISFTPDIATNIVSTFEKHSGFSYTQRYAWITSSERVFKQDIDPHNADDIRLVHLFKTAHPGASKENIPSFSVNRGLSCVSHLLTSIQHTYVAQYESWALHDERLKLFFEKSPKAKEQRHIGENITEMAHYIRGKLNRPIIPAECLLIPKLTNAVALLKEIPEEWMYRTCIITQDTLQSPRWAESLNSLLLST